LLFDILQKASKEGLMAIEKDVEEPHESAHLQEIPQSSGHDHHVVEFITDYLRMMVSGNLNAHEIESLMDSEIDTHHARGPRAVAAIAAAGRRPARLRHRGRRAGRGEHHGLGGPAAGGAGRHDWLGAGGHLPGHFAGLWRWRSRWAACWSKRWKTAAKELQCIKTTLLASMQGYNPSTAIEFGRKVLYSTERPTFPELESLSCKKK